MSGIDISTTEGVRTIAIARPEVKNALTLETMEALRDAFVAASTAADVRVVLLTGRGGCFCSGADLKSALANPAVLRNPDAAMEILHGLVRAVARCPKPTVALVDGAAVGFGVDLALACDLRVASESAYFQEKFVRIGLIPDGGGTFFLPRLVGLARAAELMMLGDKLEVADALRLGVVNRVAPSDKASEMAYEIAGRLAKGPPLALRLMKEALHKNLGTGLDGALDNERAAQVQCLQSKDLIEGVTAFFEKREPRFTGQ